MPDTERQFVVEVDASNVGVGAVLSQRAAIDQKLHPCAFFSRRLTPAERNYDIGNRSHPVVTISDQIQLLSLISAGVPQRQA